MDIFDFAQRMPRLSKTAKPAVGYVDDDELCWGVNVN